VLYQVGKTLRRNKLIEEAIAFTNTFTKVYYNKSYKRFNISKGDKVFLKLGNSYDILGVNPKLY